MMLKKVNKKHNTNIFENNCQMLLLYMIVKSTLKLTYFLIWVLHVTKSRIRYSQRLNKKEASFFSRDLKQLLNYQ